MCKLRRTCDDASGVLQPLGREPLWLSGANDVSQGARDKTHSTKPTN